MKKECNSSIRRIYWMFVLGTLLLAACEKKAPPASGPSLAAPGTLYVTKAFSVTTEHGIHGFTEGSQVSIVREEGENYVVTDGKMEAKAKKTSFTNDLTIVATIITKRLEQKQLQDQKLQENKDAKASQNRQNHNTPKVAKMTELESNIKTAETRIKVLQYELENDAKRQADAIAKHLTPNRNKEENKVRHETIDSLTKKINAWRNEMATMSTQ